MDNDKIEIGEWVKDKYGVKSMVMKILPDGKIFTMVNDDQHNIYNSFSQLTKYIPKVVKLSARKIVES